MKVTMTYKKEATMKYPIGELRLPPRLEIEFVWEDARLFDEMMEVPLGQEVTAELSASSHPVKLLAIWGSVDDLDNWLLPEKLLGQKVWAEASEAIADQASRILEIEAEILIPLGASWQQLLEIGQVNGLASLPRPRSELQRELEIMKSDPEFMNQCRALVKWMFEQNEGSN